MRYRSLAQITVLGLAGSLVGCKAAPPTAPPPPAVTVARTDVKVDAERVEQFGERRIVGAMDKAREEVAHVVAGDLGDDCVDRTFRHADAGATVALP